MAQSEPKLTNASFYGEIRFDPDSSTPTYIGLNLTNGAATSSVDWKVLKLTSTRIQTAYGSWDNRASLF
jgi:hypothetical protein